MSGFSPVTLSFMGLVFVVALCLSILAVRRDHPDHVHALWYVFSLTFCAMSVLFFYIYEHSRAIQSTPLGGMTGTIAVTFMKASMDVREEIYILLTAGALLILPQILSYLISGIFGCGSPPILVSTVSRVVTWSLIKFFCVLSGMLAAQSILALYGEPYLRLKDAPVKFVEALLMICLSFLIMANFFVLLDTAKFAFGYFGANDLECDTVITKCNLFNEGCRQVFWGATTLSRLSFSPFQHSSAN